MTEALFDTNIIVDHLRNFDHATSLISKVQEGKIIGYMSVITEAELFSGKDAEDKEKKIKLAELLSLFQIIEVDSNVARKAGEFVRKYGIALPDAIIAATAALLKCKIFTRNLKDFNHIQEIIVDAPY